MILQEFIEKWQGRFLDFDGAWGNQCFDLLREYCYECLNLTDIQILVSPTCAKELFTNFDNLEGNQYFEKITNTLEIIPQEGDIIVWGMEPYGHVAIFYNGDVNKFYSFDQNYPLNSPCHIQEHNYNDVLGWLRFKKTEETVCIPKKEYEELKEVLKIYQFFKDNGIITINDVNKLKEAIRERDGEIESRGVQIKELQDQIKEICAKLNALDYASALAGINSLLNSESVINEKERRIKDLEFQLTQKNSDLEKQKDDLISASSKISALLGHVESLEKASKLDKKTIETLSNKISKLELDLDIAKKQTKTLKTFVIGKYIIKIFEK